MTINEQQWSHNIIDNDNKLTRKTASAAAAAAASASTRGVYPPLTP